MQIGQVFIVSVKSLASWKVLKTGGFSGLSSTHSLSTVLGMRGSPDATGIGIFERRRGRGRGVCDERCDAAEG